MNNKNKQEL